MVRVKWGVMWPAIVHLGKFQITWWWLYVLTALVSSSFLIWRRLREDYPDEEIFTFNVFVLAAGIAGALAAGWLERGYFGAFSGWGMFVTGTAAIWQWCKRKKWDFWDLSDYLAVLSMWLWLLGSLALGPERKLDMGFAAGGIIILSGVKNNYRKFRWYKSGKVGLTGLIGVLYFCAAEISVAMLSPIKVYWGGLTAGQWISSWTAAFTLVGIYIRAGRKPREEWWWPVKNKIYGS